MGAASPFSSADTLLWRSDHAKQLHSILALRVWTKVFGSEPLHNFTVQKTSTPFFISIQVIPIHCLHLEPTCLLKTTNSPMKCKACCSIWIKCCILIHTVEIYANRFVQVKNTLYICMLLKYSGALNKCPEDVPPTKESINIQLVNS